ncbi:MAG: DNA recombination/repair protein RecA, partial [Chloroflexota bacterium]
QALRKLAGVISKSNTAVIFTNQLRMKIGVMYGNPETTTGGNALKFYASVRLDIRKTDAIKDGNDQTGNRVKVSVKKNKVAAPFKIAEFDIMYNEGISREGDILDTATALNIIDKRGAYYSYADMRLGQGREGAKEFLRKHADVALSIENQVRAQAGLPLKLAPITA